MTKLLEYTKHFSKTAWSIWQIHLTHTNDLSPGRNYWLSGGLWEEQILQEEGLDWCNHSTRASLMLWQCCRFILTPTHTCNHKTGLYAAPVHLKTSTCNSLWHCYSQLWLQLQNQFTFITRIQKNCTVSPALVKDWSRWNSKGQKLCWTKIVGWLAVFLQIRTMYRIWQMDTGKQRGKHMKLSLTKFLLDISIKQEIQLSIFWVTYY